VIRPIVRRYHIILIRPNRDPIMSTLRGEGQTYEWHLPPGGISGSSLEQLRPGKSITSQRPFISLSAESGRKVTFGCKVSEILIAYNSTID
jgi:hypothetical protein